MASPQIERGYTRIATELLEAIYKYITNPSWIRIALHTIRLTYGFNRKEVESNYQAYATKLNMTKEWIRGQLWEMKHAKIVRLSDVPNSRERFNISINKDYEQWSVSK